MLPRRKRTGIPEVMLSVLISLFLLFLPASASGLAGHWITPDKSIVRVYPCGDQLCIQIETLGRPDVPRVDGRNPDSSQRTRALCGLVIGTGFVPDGTGTAKDGKIYDPDSGRTYSGQMQVEGDRLRLRGYVGFSLLGRTEVWQRFAGEVGECR